MRALLTERDWTDLLTDLRLHKDWHDSLESLLDGLRRWFPI